MLDCCLSEPYFYRRVAWLVSLTLATHLLSDARTTMLVLTVSTLPAFTRCLPAPTPYLLYIYKPNGVCGPVPLFTYTQGPACGTAPLFTYNQGPACGTAPLFTYSQGPACGTAALCIYNQGPACGTAPIFTYPPTPSGVTRRGVWFSSLPLLSLLR